MSHIDPDGGQDEREATGRLGADFWADVRRDYASIWPEFLSALRQVREGWWDLVADIRQDRQFTRRMKQRATGVENPTRRQWRKALREFDKEHGEQKGGEQHGQAR